MVVPLLERERERMKRKEERRAKEGECAVLWWTRGRECALGVESVPADNWVFLLIKSGKRCNSISRRRRKESNRPSNGP